jgi:hypothetical protein
MPDYLPVLLLITPDLPWSVAGINELELTPLHRMIWAFPTPGGIQRVLVGGYWHHFAPLYIGFCGQNS